MRARLWLQVMADEEADDWGFWKVWIDASGCEIVLVEDPAGEDGSRNNADGVPYWLGNNALYQQEWLVGASSSPSHWPKAFPGNQQFISAAVFVSEALPLWLRLVPCC